MERKAGREAAISMANTIFKKRHATADYIHSNMHFSKFLLRLRANGSGHLCRWDVPVSAGPMLSAGKITVAGTCGSSHPGGFACSGAWRFQEKSDLIGRKGLLWGCLQSFSPPCRVCNALCKMTIPVKSPREQPEIAFLTLSEILIWPFAAMYFSSFKLVCFNFIWDLYGRREKLSSK